MSRRSSSLLPAGGLLLAHDGWARNATHFLGVFASYMRTVNHVEKGITAKEEAPTSTLLPCSPVAQAPGADEGSDSGDDEEEMKLNAETQAQLLKESIRAGMTFLRLGLSVCLQATLLPIARPPAPLPAATSC